MQSVTGTNAKQESKTTDMLRGIDVALNQLNDTISNLGAKLSPFCVSVEDAEDRKIPFAAARLGDMPITSKVLESIGQINRRVDSITERVSDLLNRLDG